MPSKTGRNFGMLLLSAYALALLPSVAGAETNAESIGPWVIEATYKADKFDRCTITRKLDDDIAITFVRTGDDLTLLLESPNWKLDKGAQYPVTMKLELQSWDREVAAEPNSVSMEIEDAKFVSGLRGSSSLDIVAAGATIQVPLDKSNVALDRLQTCVEKNERAVETNPFCGTGSSAIAGGPEGEAQACQEEPETAAADPQATGSMDSSEAVRPPNPKPAIDAVKPTAKNAKASSKTRSTKRTLKREFKRLRNWFEN